MDVVVNEEISTMPEALDYPDLRWADLTVMTSATFRGDGDLIRSLPEGDCRDDH